MKVKKAKKITKSKKEDAVVEEDDEFDVFGADDDAATVGSKKKIGIALFGGGTQSSAMTGLVLRGFQKKKMMVEGQEISALDKVHSISGLSGGIVPIIIYHYAQDTTSDEVLDADSPSDPTKITNEDLATPYPEKAMFSRFTKSLLPYFVIAYITAFFSGGPVYPEIMNLLHLTPFDIPSNALMTDLSVRSDVNSIPIAELAMVSGENIRACT